MITEPKCKFPIFAYSWEQSVPSVDKYIDLFEVATGIEFLNYEDKDGLMHDPQSNSEFYVDDEGYFVKIKVWKLEVLECYRLGDRPPIAPEFLYLIKAYYELPKKQSWFESLFRKKA